MSIAKIIPLLAAAALLAQAPPAPTSPEAAPGGVFRIPAAHPLPPEATAPAKGEGEGPLALVYEGKPLSVPFACTEDIMQAHGMACTQDDPCPVYAEIAGFQPLGQKLFLAGNIHDGSSTLFSLLLMSNDGGKSWTEPVERIKSAGLDRVMFADLEAGWISGHILQAIPRDPFFMITTDGGATWRRRPVFSEPRVSAIDQFWFESRTAGSMLLDRVQGAGSAGRYERYETMTGGDSWMIREVSSRKLTLKGSREVVANLDWRLRADPKLKAHVIEHRDAGRWRTVAAFQVQVGECKPDLKPLAEPVAADPQAPADAPRRPAAAPKLRKP